MNAIYDIMEIIYYKNRYNEKSRFCLNLKYLFIRDIQKKVKLKLYDVGTRLNEGKLK